MKACAPDIRVMALFSEARPYRSTLFLNHRSFVGNGFGSTYITDELFDFRKKVSLQLAKTKLLEKHMRYSRELIV